MEDGVALTACLEKCAASALDRKQSPDVQLALHAYENIRYARVTRAHGTGVSAREQWHKADWDEIRANPQSLHLKREPWLLDFDAEAHAYEVYDDVIAGLQSDVKRKTQRDPPAGSVQHEAGQRA